MLDDLEHDYGIRKNAWTYINNLMIFSDKGENWGNAREVENVIKQAKQNSAARNQGKVSLIKQDFPNPEYFEESSSKQEKSIDTLIGLEGVKESLKELEAKIAMDKEFGKKVIPGHYMFAGKPGTGKTTVANLMAKKFYELGLLKTNKLISKTASDLLGSYVGQTEERTKKIFQDAIGGILFIDEAHQFIGGTADHSYGKQAINTLVPLMENHRHEICVIFAGYKDKLEQLFAYDPGFKSRINSTIYFEDYTSAEMLQIFYTFKNKEYSDVKTEDEVNTKLGLLIFKNE